MKKGLLSVDIIIPQYKNIDLLKRLLESMSNIIFPCDITNVWIIENGGKFGAEYVVGVYKDKIPVKYVYMAEGNLSLARNKGIELSSADVLVFFDNDMTFYSHSLVAYVTNFKKYGDSYFYGGALEPDYQKEPEKWLVPFLPNSAKGFSLGRDVVEHEKPDFLGGNHAVFRKHLVEIGGYDCGCAIGDNAGFMGEETRLQQKLLDKKIKGLYLPDACVKHYVPEQNCSEEWILQRATRNGLTLGENYPKNNYQKLFGVPIYHLRIIANHLIHIVLHIGNKKQQFNYRFQLTKEFSLVKQLFKNRHIKNFNNN
jgi:cellulose synthase/poly-beta-1,6-N-acetylglucosamine synthase-like glycosyltransferase